MPMFTAKLISGLKSAFACRALALAAASSALAALNFFSSASSALNAFTTLTDERNSRAAALSASSFFCTLPKRG